MKDSRLLPLAILLTLIGFLANSWLSQPHPVVPASAPAAEFSAERAMQLLEQILAENEPHPVGSPANHRVKRRIQAWLDQQGIAHEEQGAWACRKNWPGCAYAENIIATLPGEVDGPYVALMAHYDSVPHAPGAGDDMAGVVAVLETARALQAAGGLRHPVLLLITDAEETGLHGAEAFFQHHELAGQLGVILNVEGSGTRGVSQVLRTSMPNAWYMNLFKASAAQPAGTSIANEVFKRMPNDTDFSVSMAAGVPGIDFAFAAERNHYHTPNDNADNLDPRTIQHHGDNLFPLALQLSRADLDAGEQGSVVYQGSYGAWFQWPSWASVLLLGLAGLLLLAAGRHLDESPLRLLLTTLLLPLAVLAAGGILVHLCFALLDKVHGTTVSWPAYNWPYRTIVFTGMLVPALLLARWLSSRVSAPGLLVSGWLFLWLLTLGLVFFLPDAASVFLVMLLPAGALLVAAAWLPLPEPARAACRLATLLFSSLFLGAATIFEESQGFQLFFAVWPWVGLFALSAFAFARGRWLATATAAATTLLAVSLAAALLLPLYSEHRPQHLSVYYVQEAEASEAMVNLWTDGAPPPGMLAAADFLPEGRAIVPWSDEPWEHIAPVQSANLPAPTLAVEHSRGTDTGREVRLRLSSNRGAWLLRLDLPRSAAVRQATVGSSQALWERREGADPEGYDRLRLYGAQGRDVVVTLQLDSTEPLEGFLIDYAPQLPEPAQTLLAARPATAVPVHSGDLALVYTAVSF